MTTVYRYHRVSHESSKQSGLGILEQQQVSEACVEYLRKMGKIPTDAEVAEPVEDLAVSAFRKKLIERPEGRRLCQDVQPGDHIVFARLDRAFRNVNELTAMLKLWKDKGVHIHFADVGLDTDSPIGEFVLQILGAVAELHSKYLSERSKAVCANLKAQKRPHGPINRSGMMRVGPKGNRRYISDPGIRPVMHEIVRLRDEEGKTWVEISDIIEEKLAAREHRPMIPKYNPWKPREFYPTHVADLYRAEKRNRADGY